jgi:hypothetical protein
VINATFTSLTLSWDPNPEDDVVGYDLFELENPPFPWPVTKVNAELITGTTFEHSGLRENTKFYYVLQAVDDVNLTSGLTDFVVGQTLMIPKAPIINNSISDILIKEDAGYKNEYLLYWIFSDPNNDNLTFRVEGATNINITLYQENGTLILMPELDWNGVETLTIYANDSIFEISFDVKVEARGMNDPPDTPEIVKPQDGLEIEEGKALDFQGRCFDPDLPYGDELTFEWSSSIDGELGSGPNMSGVKLSSGDHLITLEVSDKHGEKSTITINVKVVEKSDEEGLGKVLSVVVPVIVIIIIIAIIIFLMFLKKRKKQEVGESENEDPGPVIDYSQQAPTEEIQSPPPQNILVTEYTIIEEPQVQEAPSDELVIEPAIQHIPETPIGEVEEFPLPEDIQPDIKEPVQKVQEPGEEILHEEAEIVGEPHGVIGEGEEEIVNAQEE